MNKRKLFWLLFFFVLYEVLVWVGSLLFLADSSLLVGFVLSVCGVTVLLVYVLVARLSAAAAPPPAAAPGPPAASASPAAPQPAPAAASAGSSEAAALIQEANEKLARSPTLASQRVKSTIADFPLYFLIGSQGSGKTSLFLASKCEPDLLAGQVHRESAVVPTRLGNIWFADGTVVVEAAGDFFAGDVSRWNDFIASFHRPKGSSRLGRIFGGAVETRLGGVLLCCDASIFIGVPDSARLQAIARVVQQRLRSIATTFRRDFPVYIIFTKSDTIPYFGEYFGRLSEAEDGQILGCTLAGDAAAINENLTASLNKLYLSLADKRVTFLEREREAGKRPAIYEFPREFKRFRGPLVQFLLDLFRLNPLEANPRLVGVYFTGTRTVAAQAMDPDRSVIQKVGDVTRILRADDLRRLRSQTPDSRERESLVTRWSFVSDLWQQILRRRPAAVATQYLNQKQLLYRRLAFLSAIVVFGLAAILFANSFFRNHALVTAVQAAAVDTEPLRAGSTPTMRNLQQIDVLRARAEALVNNKPGWLMHFGFYEGRKMRDPVFSVYYTRFREYFLNPLIRRLEDQLSSLPAEQSASYPYGSVYSSLQTYRTVTHSPNEASCKPDAGLADRMMGLWRQDRALDPEGERIARANFQFFVSSLRANRIPEQLQVASKDDGVVQPGRRYLRAFKGAEPQYHRIIEQVNQEMGSAARLADLTHNTNYRRVLRVQEEVPGAFSRAGWDRVQQLIDSEAGGNASEACVLGNGGGALAALSAGAGLKDQIREMYIEDYVRHWKDFLAGASVLPYSNCGDAAEKLTSLKENSSPILAVLMLASLNTTLPKHSGSPLQQAGRAVDNVRKGFKFPFSRSKDDIKSQAAKGLGEALASAPTQDTITATFQPAHAVFEASPPNPDHWTDKRNTPYLDALGELQRAFQTLDRGGRCDESNEAANSQANAKLMAAQGVLDGLVRNFDNQGSYDAVKNFLESPLQAAKGLIAADPSEVAKRKLNGAQQQLCSGLNALKTKFPFSPQGDDASLDQVGKVFDPKGGLLAAMHQTLGDLVMKSAGGFTQKPDAPVKLSRTFLDFFTRMSAISDALYPAQGGAPGMKYKLSVEANPAIKEIAGTVDGEPVAMASKEYVWPGPKPGIDLRVLPVAGGSNALRSYSGPWAIFQLLSNADHTPGTNQFRLVNVQGGRRSNPQPILPDGSPIILDVTQYPNGVSQAFDRDFFAVSCPARITE